MNGSVSAVCSRPVWPSPTPEQQHRHDRRGGERDLLGRLRGEVGPGQPVEGGGQVRGSLPVADMGVIPRIEYWGHCVAAASAPNHPVPDTAREGQMQLQMSCNKVRNRFILR